MIARIRCLFRGVHAPLVRQPLGGFRCTACGIYGADLADLGYGIDAGYVSPVRRVFSRERHEVTRTSAWAPSRRGW